MTPRELCARVARCVPNCDACMHCFECDKAGEPLPKLARYAWHIQRDILPHAMCYLPNEGAIRVNLELLPAVLEDDASVLLKIRVACPELNNRASRVYLTGRESAYIIIRQIIRAWRSLIVVEV